MIASSAVPRPYQPGRLARDWDHANTHGIARSESMSGGAAAAAAPPGRDAGREPRPRPGIRSIGVAAWKNAANPGRSTSAR